MKKIKDFTKFNETLIDGVEYPISENDFEYLTRSGGSRYAYSNNSDNFNNKRNIRVYNHNTKEHFYLENIEVKPGDNNLLFVDFPRTDAPINSWGDRGTQYVNIRTWGSSREDHAGDFVRFEIKDINKDGYCTVTDGYNTEGGGVYARDSFYRILKKS